MMRGRHARLRTTVGALIAALLALALLPAGAYAAPAGAAAEVNLALGKRATASGAHDGYPAGQVTDGTQQSYWEGPAGSYPAWVQVDLGSAVRVDRVVLKLPAAWEARTQTLAVLGSTDGGAFTPLAASAAGPSPRTGRTRSASTPAPPPRATSASR